MASPPFLFLTLTILGQVLGPSVACSPVKSGAIEPTHEADGLGIGDARLLVCAQLAEGVDDDACEGRAASCEGRAASCEGWAERTKDEVEQDGDYKEPKREGVERCATWRKQGLG